MPNFFVTEHFLMDFDLIANKMIFWGIYIGSFTAGISLLGRLVRSSAIFEP